MIPIHPRTGGGTDQQTAIPSSHNIQTNLGLSLSKHTLTAIFHPFIGDLFRKQIMRREKRPTVEVIFPFQLNVSFEVPPILIPVSSVSILNLT